MTEGWRRFGAAVAAALAAWLLAAGVAAPLLLGAVAADGTAARLLEGLRGSLRDGVLLLLAFGATVPAVAALRPSRVAGWVRPATAEALGAIRAWIAAILLASVLWEDLPSTAALPRGMLGLDEHWLVGLLHPLPIGFDRFLASPAALLAFEWATVLLLAAAAAGLRTRWSVPAGALAYLLFASILRSYAWSYHTGLVPLYVLLLLAFTPCGDAFSLDRLLRRRRGVPVEPARVPRLRYGVGRWLVWAGVALPYTMAGLSKLRNTGPLWWEGEHMRQMVVATVVEPMQFDFRLTYLMVDWPAWVFGALGLASLVGEVAFVLVLVSPLVRRVLPLATAGMHVGILLMQNILLPDLIAIQAVFYDWTPLRARLAAAWARARALARLPAAAPPAGGVTGSGGPRDVDAAVRRQARAAQAFLVVAFLAWATRTERFPVTAMQMFSRPSPLEPVEYVRPLVRYADGSVERARFERWIGAVADARYRRLLRQWDEHPERLPLLREFLDACARRANAGAPPGRRVVGFELELRRWDFRRHPRDPDHGELVRVVRHDVAPAGR
ncbi:MAG TPA: hypothetical protein VHG51_01410 [Longimicrobiaceae bacterium]|nr:hypothetical protein [Longimicrobiaceae bacterium]